MPRSRFLFACELGDPVSSIHLGDAGCMAGSAMGKIWLFHFDSREAEMLAGWSDEGVRGLYMDEDACFATLNECCRSWRRQSPHAACPVLSFRTLDKKNTQTVKHVLQRGAWACVLFPISSMVVHLARQEHHHRSFKLFDFGPSTEVAPCDFDGESVVIVDRSTPGAPPVFRLIQLERNEHTELSTLPRAGPVSILKLWGSDCLAYVVGSALYLYDHRTKELKHSLLGHRAEIVAVDAQDPLTIASLDAKAVVKLWNGVTGECISTTTIPEATYFLGYPYFLSVRGSRILTSADQGVFLTELDVDADAAV